MTPNYPPFEKQLNNVKEDVGEASLSLCLKQLVKMKRYECKEAKVLNNSKRKLKSSKPTNLSITTMTFGISHIVSLVQTLVGRFYFQFSSFRYQFDIFQSSASFTLLFDHK